MTKKADSSRPVARLLRGGKYIFPVMVLLFIGGILIFFSFQHKDREKNHLLLSTQQQRFQLSALTISLENIADAIFENTINTLEIRQLMARADSAPEEERNRLREQLLNTLLPLYSNIKEQGVRQLHFHLPESISFLRFHRPDFHGDSLQGVRYSIDKVNITRKPERGFEEGKVYYGFRNVYPIHYQEKFVGTVEISFSFLAIRELAVQIFPAIYTLLMHKETVQEAVPESERTRYTPCIISNYHFKDQDVVFNIQQELPNLNIVPFNTLVNINKSLRPMVEDRMLRGEEFSIPYMVKSHNKMLLVTFLPIYNIKGKQVAYFVSYKEDQYLIDFQRRYNRMRLFMISIGVLLLLAGQIYQSQEKKKVKYLELASTDSLTKVANRLHFDLVADQVIRETKRRKGVFSLVMLDIDDFKKVNDTYGHEAGDQVLISTASTIQRSLREQDFFARWGGEEFVILLPGTSAEQACIAVEKARIAVEKSQIMAAGKKISVTCSFGVTEFVNGTSKEHLFQKADMALYQAKASGKNCIMGC